MIVIVNFQDNNLKVNNYPKQKYYIIVTGKFEMT